VTKGDVKRPKGHPLVAKIAPWIAIVALIVFASLLKHHHWSVRGQRPFYSDAAFRYRYALMAADGTPIPDVDYAVQHPEGLNLREKIPLTPEIVIGTTYRILFGDDSRVSFDRFLIVFVCTFSSLSIIAVFLMAYAIWGSRWGAIVAALFYTVATPAFERTVGNYLTEDFVLPFIFLGLTAFIWAAVRLRRSRAGWQIPLLAVLAGLALAVALISWNLSQFIVALLILFCVLVTLLRRELHDTMIVPNLAIIILIAAVIGIAHPVLRARWFFVSYPMLAAYALIIVSFLDRRFEVGRPRRLALFIVAFSALGAIALLLPRQAAEFSRVASFLFTKLRFLGQKPADPGLITFDDRAFWLGPWRGPALISILFSYVALLPLAVVPLWMRGYELRRGARSSAHARTAAHQERMGYFFLLYWTAVSLGLYLFTHRLTVLLVFFAAVAIGGWLSVFTRPNLRWVPLLLIPLLLFEGHKAFTYMSRRPLYVALSRIIRPEPPNPYAWYGENVVPVFTWIVMNTEEDDVFLTLFPTGPTLLAYTGRAIVLNPMFGSEQMRRKGEECTRAYFGLESDLLDICRKYEVDYLLYDARVLLGHDTNSVRYLAGERTVTTSMATYRLHFAPDLLHDFIPLYQNNYFRVLEVRGPEEELSSSPVLTYAPLYDRELFSKIVGSEGVLDDEAIDVAIARLHQAMYHLTYGMNLMNRGLMDPARAEYEASVRAVPSLQPAHTSLAYAHQMGRRWDGAIEHYREAIRLSPDDAFAHYNLGRVLYTRKGLVDSSMVHFGTVLQLDPYHTKARNDLAYIYWARGDTARAIEAYEMVLAIDPADSMALWALGELGQGGNE